jgi:hypothetical protein
VYPEVTEHFIVVAIEGHAVFPLLVDVRIEPEQHGTQRQHKTFNRLFFFVEI